VTKTSEPVFNVPAVVLAIIAVFVLVRAGEELLLTSEEDVAFLYYFAFVPARYDGSLLILNLRWSRSPQRETCRCL